MDFRKLLLIPVLFFTLTPVVYGESTASSVEAVYRYFNKLKTFNASFHQRVRDSKGEMIQQSKGEVWIEKPGMFRWDYQSPFVQQIVANGKELWTYDPDLEQATVKIIDDVLSMTPAMLLSGIKDLDELTDVKHIGSTGNEFWFQLAPKNSNESADTVEISFRQQQLYAIRILDGFMNTTTITFSDQTLNHPLPKDHFSLQLPDNTDILGSQ